MIVPGELFSKELPELRVWSLVCRCKQPRSYGAFDYGCLKGNELLQYHWQGICTSHVQRTCRHRHFNTVAQRGHVNYPFQLFSTSYLEYPITDADFPLPNWIFRITNFQLAYFSLTNRIICFQFEYFSLPIWTFLITNLDISHHQIEWFQRGLPHLVQHNVRTRMASTNVGMRNLNPLTFSAAMTSCKSGTTHL